MRRFPSRVSIAVMLIAAFWVPVAGRAAPLECAGKAATVIGTSGDDVLTGTSAPEVFHGLGGNDVIRGKGGGDTICGGSGNDTLDGGGGDDAVFGGDGRDILIGGLGADKLVGGFGADWAKFTYRGSSGVAVSLVSNTAEPNVGAIWGLGDIDDLDGIENVIGTDGADMLIGNDRRNVLRGRAGDDEIIPLRKGDTIDGGDGFDWVDYSPNSRRVVVNLNKGIAKGSGRDRIVGVEAVWGTDFADKLTGNAADNYLFGAGGADSLVGRGGSDSLEPGAGDDSVDGGGGEDWVLYHFETGPVTVDLRAGLATGAGRDSLTDIESARGTDRNDTLLGNGASNYLIGGPGDDALRGRGGTDNFEPGAGNDTVSGGSGSDWVYYWTSSSGVVVDLVADTATGSGRDTLLSIEAAVGSDQDDQLTGDAGNNSLWGFGGDDTVRGGKGDDFVQGGGGGQNLLVGGPGHDIIRFNLYDGPAVFDLRAGRSTLNGIDTLHGFEGVWGTAFDDELTGDAGNNTLRGLEGNDVLLGLAGNDDLDGGPGSDRLNGGTGTDSCLDGEQVSDCEILAAGQVTGMLRLPDPTRRPAGDALRSVVRSGLVTRIPR